MHPVDVTLAELDAVRAFARDDRLSGLAAAAMQHGTLRPAILGEATDGVIDDWHEALRACVVLEALLLRVADQLDAAGVRWRLTKGPAVAHLDYPDPSLRTFADLDLVIHPDDWLAVDRHFFHGDGEGAQRAFAMRFGKGRTVLIDDMEVDLHRRFAVGAFGLRADMHACFDTFDIIELGGRTIPTLSAEMRMLHACFHAVFGGASELRAVRDIAQLAVMHPESVHAALHRAADWRVEPVVEAAFAAAIKRLGLPPGYLPSPPTRRITLAERHTLRVFRRHPGFRRQALTTLTSLRAREVMPFIRSLVALRRAPR